MSKKETFNVDLEVKQVRDNVLKGLASTFDVDLTGERVQRGAFQKTIEERVEKGKVKLLIDHNPEKVIGVLTKAKETEDGLFIESKLSEIDRAQEVKTLIEENILDGMSVGFEAVRDGFENRDGRSVRVIKEAKLMEVSVTPIPANENATITNVKDVMDKIENMSKEQRDDLIEQLKSMDTEEKSQDEEEEKEDTNEESEDEEDISEEKTDEEEGIEQDKEENEEKKKEIEEKAMELDVLETVIRAQKE